MTRNRISPRSSNPDRVDEALSLILRATLEKSKFHSNAEIVKWLEIKGYDREIQLYVDKGGFYPGDEIGWPTPALVVSMPSSGVTRARVGSLPLHYQGQPANDI
ncbi:hypothetical protein J6590_065706 [Homalodisca vitripennis]|nr:hypothetical protein J6590_065706 [Homalodisca vitripennis]